MGGPQAEVWAHSPEGVIKTGHLRQGLGRRESIGLLRFPRMTFDCPLEPLICPSLCFLELEAGTGTEGHLCVCLKASFHLQIARAGDAVHSNPLCFPELS